MATESTNLIFNLIGNDKVSKEFVKAGAAISGVTLVVGEFAKQSVEAYVKAETAQSSLSAAYSKFPKLADVSLKSLKDLADETEKKTVFDHNATMAAEGQLAMFNLTGKQVEQLIPLIQDYAAKTGTDLVTAATNVGRAFEGNTRALKAVGINFKATGDTAKDFATIQADLNAKVGGFAEVQGKTAAGQAQILSNQYELLKESVGAALVPALKDLVAVATPILETFNKLPEPVKQTAIVLGGVAIAARIIIPALAEMKAGLATLGATAAVTAPELVAVAAAETEAGSAAVVAGTEAEAAGGRFATAGAAAGSAGLLIGAAFLNVKVSADGNQKFMKAVADQWAKTADIGGGDLGPAIKDVGAASDVTATATKNLAAATAAAIPVYKSYALSIEASTLRMYDAADADAAATKAIKALGSGHKETSQVVRDSMRVIFNAADAVRAKYGDTVKGDQAYRAELDKLRDKVAKGSPLRKQLDDFIARLDEAAKQRTAQLVLQIAYGKTVAAGQGVHNAKTHGFAAGGYASGLAMGNEYGPELVDYGSSAFVRTATQTKAIMSRDDGRPLAVTVVLDGRVLVQSINAQARDGVTIRTSA